MDDFNLDRPELQGAYLTLEFGMGGRVQQLWCADAARPSDGEEFQFVAPPIAFGEEFAEDYFPGTILIGARTDPEEPWILSRNSEIEVLDDENGVTFDYRFGLLDEIRAVGRYYERTGPTSTVVWELTLTNRSRKTVEIGELAFPFALNNVYDGFPRSEDGLKNLYQERVLVHKAICGSASYLFAQRLNARPPGLLIFPGGDTQWEFYNHVAASLATPYRWEGIPVVYIHSQATVEREGWSSWFSQHTSAILEPGESRVYETCFAPAHRDEVDEVHAVLIANSRPAVRLVPSAIAPVGLGIGVEVTGVTPTQFNLDVEAETETDADEDGGFCFVHPREPGPVKVSFEDTEGRTGEAHLLFIEPIEDLIQARASWIMDHQRVVDPTSAFFGAILPSDNRTGEPITDPTAYHSAFGVESSLCDALFLAEKNTIFPDQNQIEALCDYLDFFVSRRLQNPGDFSVGAILADERSVASHFGRASLYPILTLLYNSMARIALGYGGTRHSVQHYLEASGQTFLALFANGNPSLMEGIGLPLMSCMDDVVDDIANHHSAELSELVAQALKDRDDRVIQWRFPFAPLEGWSTLGFEEAFAAAVRVENREIQRRLLRYSQAGKSLTPSWWWLGTDHRWGFDSEIFGGVPDKGQLCFAPSTVANSLLFFNSLNRDYNELPDLPMRLAFSGLIANWALVRKDGAAGMGFSPDSASRYFGMAPVSGDVGLGLFLYLRKAGAFLLPSRHAGGGAFGAHFESDAQGTFTVKPWDGVGRIIVVRQFGIEARTQNARMKELTFDGTKRWVSLLLHNPSDRTVEAQLTLKGLWGKHFTLTKLGESFPVQAQEGEIFMKLSIGARRVEQVEVRVMES